MESTNHMLTKSGPRDFEKEMFPCVSMCFKKEIILKKKNTLDKDFITQPFLKLYAKLKGNTHGIKKPHADGKWATGF